jgi:hypothetical protein
MRSVVTLASSAVLSAGLLLGVPVAHADTNSVTAPIGTLQMTINGGAFTEECTDFPYTVVVTGALPRVQWSAEIDADRDGGGTVSGMLTDYGSGTFTGDLMICSGDGAGSWTATVDVRMADPADATAVYSRTMTIDFTISKASTATTITSVNLGSSRTKVTGTVLDSTGGSETTASGYVTVKVKKSGDTWREKGRVQVAEDGTWSLRIGKAYASGTQFKAVFEGTDEAKRSTSAVFTS